MRLTPKQVQEIIALYPNELASVIAAQYNTSVNIIYATAKRYKVKKSAEFMASTNSGRIRKGQHLSPETQIVPGQKIYGPRQRNQPKKPHPTAWRKGNAPQNTAADGEVRLRTVGWMIRISEKHWIFYKRWLWEQTYGEIPPGCNIVLKQGIPFSRTHPPTIEQLECLTDLQLIDRNSGRDELTDEYVISKLTHCKPHLKAAISQMPELIELKRTQIKLRRTINEHQQIKQND